MVNHVFQPNADPLKAERREAPSHEHGQRHRRDDDRIKAFDSIKIIFHYVPGFNKISAAGFMYIYNFVSFGGIFGLMFVAWLCSANRRLLNWRVISWGTVLQLIFAALVFWAPGSRSLFQWLNDAVLRLLAASEAGQKFVFGALGTGETNLGFILAFQALPIIIFFSALMGLLYYWESCRGLSASLPGFLPA